MRGRGGGRRVQDDARRWGPTRQCRQQDLAPPSIAVKHRATVIGIPRPVNSQKGRQRDVFDSMDTECAVCMETCSLERHRWCRCTCVLLSQHSGPCCYNIVAYATTTRSSWPVLLHVSLSDRSIWIQSTCVAPTSFWPVLLQHSGLCQCP